MQAAGFFMTSFLVIMPSLWSHLIVSLQFLFRSLQRWFGSTHPSNGLIFDAIRCWGDWESSGPSLVLYGAPRIANTPIFLNQDIYLFKSALRRYLTQSWNLFSRSTPYPCRGEGRFEGRRCCWRWLGQHWCTRGWRICTSIFSRSRINQLAFNPSGFEINHTVYSSATTVLQLKVFSISVL